MENSNLNFGKIISRVLTLIIVKPIVLPFKIYKNTLHNLSNYDNENLNESLLDGDFPLYNWFISVFDASIALSYFFGGLGAIFALINGTGFSVFLITIIITYFIPLSIGFFKELFSITLKTLTYLMKIANK